MSRSEFGSWPPRPQGPRRERRLHRGRVRGGPKRAGRREPNDGADGENGTQHVSSKETRELTGSSSPLAH